jgi:hypothetical protein
MGFFQFKKTWFKPKKPGLNQINRVSLVFLKKPWFFATLHKLQMPLNFETFQNSPSAPHLG